MFRFYLRRLYSLKHSFFDVFARIVGWVVLRKKNRIKIRKAKTFEWKSIVRFFDAHLHNPYHDPGFLPSGLIRDKIRRGNLFIATMDGRIVGAAISNGRTLWNLVVHKNFKRQKVGSTLLRKINPKYVRIKSQGGFPDPTSFYIKNGYKPLGFVPSKVTQRKTILLAVKEDTIVKN